MLVDLDHGIVLHSFKDYFPAQQEYFAMRLVKDRFLSVGILDPASSSAHGIDHYKLRNEENSPIFYIRDFRFLKSDGRPSFRMRSKNNVEFEFIRDARLKPIAFSFYFDVVLIDMSPRLTGPEISTIIYDINPTIHEDVINDVVMTRLENWFSEPTGAATLNHVMRDKTLK